MILRSYDCTKGVGIPRSTSTARLMGKSLGAPSLSESGVKSNGVNFIGVRSRPFGRVRKPDGKIREFPFSSKASDSGRLVRLNSPVAFARPNGTCENHQCGTHQHRNISPRCRRNRRRVDNIDLE